MTEPAQLYRYRETRFSDGLLMLTLLSYEIEKTTACGWWVRVDLGLGRRFVKKDARNRFACETKEQALESFRARKRRQIRILRRQLQEAEAALAMEDDGSLYPLGLMLSEK